MIIDNSMNQLFSSHLTTQTTSRLFYKYFLFNSATIEFITAICMNTPNTFLQSILGVRPMVNVFIKFISNAQLNLHTSLRLFEKIWLGLLFCFIYFFLYLIIYNKVCVVASFYIIIALAQLCRE